MQIAVSIMKSIITPSDIPIYYFVHRTNVDSVVLRTTVRRPTLRYFIFLYCIPISGIHIYMRVYALTNERVSVRMRVSFAGNI